MKKRLKSIQNLSRASMCSAKCATATVLIIHKYKSSKKELLYRKRSSASTVTPNSLILWSINLLLLVIHFTPSSSRERFSSFDTQHDIFNLKKFEKFTNRPIWYFCTVLKLDTWPSKLNNKWFFDDLIPLVCSYLLPDRICYTAHFPISTFSHFSIFSHDNTHVFSCYCFSCSCLRLYGGNSAYDRCTVHWFQNLNWRCCWSVGISSNESSQKLFQKHGREGQGLGQ